MAGGVTLIENLKISNIGVIESAELELSPGFNCLTGETGAGKTMVLTALGLLLGGRADSSAVRHGADQLRVSASWQVSSQPSVNQKVDELGGDLQDGSLLVNRSLSSEGKSRVSIGGAQAPVAALAEIGEALVAVHGQSDQLRLKSTTAQRDALDNFAGRDFQVKLNEYKLIFRQWRESLKRLDRLRNASGADQARALELREFLGQLEALDPKANELDELQIRILRIESVASLSEAAETARELISSTDRDSDVLSLLSQARRSLDGMAGKDQVIAELASRTTDLGVSASDLASDLSRFLSSLEVSPGELDLLQERRSALNSLTRRWGASLEELLDRSKVAVTELLDLEAGDDQIEILDRQIEDQHSQLSALAQEISSLRRAAALTLGSSVTAELKELALGGAEFSVGITEASDFDVNGRDQIEFLLAPHPGAAKRPVHKGASGGELSRVMLAIELVLADEHQAPTMVFDEVDSGVGGMAAVELGKRLQKLARTTQVIVVTHLPQVAAFADTQLRVLKASDGQVTASTVRQLNAVERVDELARMLSGDPESSVAREHAQELLENARRLASER